jgi:BON domain-containing protein
MTNHSLSWLGPIGIGAAIMYLFDPNQGRRRRALLRDQTTRVARRARDTSSALACDVQNRVAGIRAGMERMSHEEFVDDATLDARVRSKLGRVSTHPGAIGVQVLNGIATLTGPVLADEHRAVLRTVERVSGVREVIDQFSVHSEPGSIPGLQGDGSRSRNTLLGGQWSPTARLAGVGAGAVLIAYGMRQRSLGGGLAASIGAALLSRGLVGLDVTDRVVDTVRSYLPSSRPTFDIAAADQGMLGGVQPREEGGYV